MSDKDLSTIEDEELLHKMMNETENFEERKKIRARLKEIREAKSDSRAVLDAASKRNSAAEEAVFSSTKSETAADGSKVTTHVKTTTNTTKDGNTTTTKQTRQITKTGGFGGTSYNIAKTNAEEAAKNLANLFSDRSNSGTSGEITVRTEHWSSKDQKTQRTHNTQTWAAKPGAKAAFQNLDSENAKPNFLGAGGASGGGKVAVQRSPSAIKQMLLDWCKKVTEGYPHVNVTNFSSSWNDGMAFCALIHHFYPKTFDFNRLDPKKRRGNFRIAFDVAEKFGGIAPLLEVDDMVRMKNPDWKCVFTYVQSFYRRFRNFDPNNPNAEPPTSPPSTPTTPATPSPTAAAIKEMEEEK